MVGRANRFSRGIRSWKLKSVGFGVTLDISRKAGTAVARGKSLKTGDSLLKTSGIQLFRTSPVC